MPSNNPACCDIKSQESCAARLEESAAASLNVSPESPILPESSSLPNKTLPPRTTRGVPPVKLDL